MEYFEIYYEIIDRLVKKFNYCQEMAEKNVKAKNNEMAFAWRQKASGVMDTIYIVRDIFNDKLN